MTRLTTLTLLVLMLATAALAQAPPTRTDDPTFPAGLEGERYGTFIEAVNSHDLGLAERFYGEHVAEGFKDRFTLESYLEGYQWISSTTGGLDFHSVRTYDPPRPNLTTVVCSDRLYGAWWAIVFHYEGDPAEGLTDMQVLRASMPEAVAADRLSKDEFAAELGGALERICEAGLFSGTVLVAAGHDVIFEHACGTDEAPENTPLAMGTRFDLGPVGEMFTAVAVMQLAEKGLLSVDDPVGKYLVSPLAAAQRVTVGQLLGHATTAADSLARIVEGSSGKPILGTVIESVAGTGYGDYLWENVFGPAGMADTDAAGPHGSVRTTAPDLHRFTAALASGSIVSGKSIPEMWKDQSGGRGYGYGFAVRKSPKGLVVGHDGATGGGNISYGIYVQTGHTVVVMANLEGAAWPVEAMMRDLMARLE